MEKKNLTKKNLYARTVDGEIVEIVATSNDITDLIRDGDDIAFEEYGLDSRGNEIYGTTEIKDIDSETIKSIGAPNIVKIRTSNFHVWDWIKNEKGEWY